MEIPNFGYFAFLRELEEIRTTAATVAEMAADRDLPDWTLPPAPDDRKIASRILSSIASSVRRKKLSMQAIDRSDARLAYEVFSPGGKSAESDSKKGALQSDGIIAWLADKPETLHLSAGLAVEHPVATEALNAYAESRQVLSRADWVEHMRQLFTGQLAGYPARSAGVVYWVSPEDSAVLERLGELMERAAGLSLVVAPCVDRHHPVHIVTSCLEKDIERVTSAAHAPARRAELLTLMQNKANFVIKRYGIATDKVQKLTKQLAAELQAALDKAAKDKPEAVEAAPAPAPTAGKPPPAKKKRARKSKKDKAAETKTETPPVPNMSASTAGPQIPAPPVAKKTIELKGGGAPPVIETLPAPAPAPAPAPSALPAAAPPPPAPAPPLTKERPELISLPDVGILSPAGELQNMFAYDIVGEPAPFAQWEWHDLPDGNAWIAIESRIYTVQPLRGAK